MQLGFVSAIFPDLTLEEVIAFAADEGFACVELMCWPPGEADRRYAGVTHLDVTRLDEEQAGKVRDLVRKQNIAISALGYYPNPLDPNLEDRRVCLEHLKQVIAAAPRLDVRLVNTFVGRDPDRSVEANWPLFQEVWPDLVQYAEQEGVNLGIENCPMLFSIDEWPGGKNLAVSPAIWAAMFAGVSQPSLRTQFRPFSSGLAAHRLCPVHSGLRPADSPRPRQGHPDRPGPAVQFGNPWAWLAHAQAARPRGCGLGKAVFGADGCWLRGAGLHRSRRPGLRRLACRPPTLPAAEQALPRGVCILKSRPAPLRRTNVHAPMTKEC